MVRAIMSLFTFAHHWCISRQWKRLIGTLPALITLCGIVGVVAAAKFSPRDRLLEEYEKSTEQAKTAAEFEAASVYLRRQIQFRPDSTELKMEQVRMYEHMEKWEEAESLLSTMAPSEGMGVAEAHAHKAHYLAKRGLSRDQLLEFERHLTKALELEPDNPLANALMANLHLQRGDRRRAAECLAIASDRNPILRLTLAEIYRSMGDQARAEDQGLLAEVHFRSEVAQHPEDVDSRLYLTKAYVLLNRYRDAQKTLSEGLRREENEQLRNGLAELHIMWADEARKNRKFTEFADHIEQALAAGPAHPEVLSYVTKKVLLAEDSELTEIKKRLKQSLASGGAGISAHFVLGTVAAVKGESQVALLHLEQAIAEQPKSVIIANNLAWVLLHTEGGDLQRALELTNVALAIRPNEPRVLDTRGRILTRLERWKEAVKDLEAALAHVRNDPGLHSALATCYDELGDAELAAEHRRLARGAR